MAVKSLEELREIRERSRSKVGLRHGEDRGGGETEILVGMATCGIAAGARETLGALTAELARRGVEGVRVVPVGCVGYCKLEPVVMVNRPGEKTCVYGNVGKDRVPELVESHIVGGRPVESLRVEVDLENILYRGGDEA